MKNKFNLPTNDAHQLFSELVEIIEFGQKQVAIAVNSGVVITFWQVGKRVNTFILDNQRAEYGKQIVVTLSRELQLKYGNNFEEKNLRRMLQFATEFEDFENVGCPTLPKLQIESQTLPK